MHLTHILPREPGVAYPRCTDGARACPLEDCGGIYDYAMLCAALNNPAQIGERTEELLEWLGEDFDPAHFDPDKVVFESAAQRLKALFSDS